MIAAGGYRNLVEREAALRWVGANVRVDWRARGELHAYVNHSNWVVDCVFCRDALVAEPGEPFFCPNCCMVSNNGLAMAVIFPDNRAEIERVLLMRPDPEKRNWKLGETVEQLVAENIEHGIGIGS